MVPNLKPEQLEELRAELERQVAKLERSMRTTREAARPVQLDQSAVGRLSRIDSIQNQGLTRNLHEREHAKLGLLESALERLEAGTYGVCTSCGGAIALGRLVVFPEAPTCAACGG